jgi:hypothetical protein
MKLDVDLTLHLLNVSLQNMALGPARASDLCWLDGFRCDAIFLNSVRKGVTHTGNKTRQQRHR